MTDDRNPRSSSDLAQTLVPTIVEQLKSALLPEIKNMVSSETQKLVSVTNLDAPPKIPSGHDPLGEATPSSNDPSGNSDAGTLRVLSFRKKMISRP